MELVCGAADPTGSGVGCIAAVAETVLLAGSNVVMQPGPHCIICIIQNASFLSGTPYAFLLQRVFAPLPLLTLSDNKSDCRFL